MQVRQDYSTILHWNEIATSLYLPLFIAYLYYNSLLLLIGNVVNLNNILILAALEVTKYALYARGNKTWAHKHVRDIFKSILAVLVHFAAMYGVIVLFGAEVFSNIQETFMLTLLITTLTALPICLHFGADNALSMFLSITSLGSGEIQSLFMVKLRFTLFGVWLGALVIPLDWNRPWQNWPIPCSFGALCGYTVSSWLCCGLQFYQRSKLGKRTGKYAL